MATPLVSVLVLNYRTPQRTVACVQALKQQTVADSMEIIVIDNHSEDDSAGVLRNRLGEIQNVRIVETGRNRGFGGGYNVGARFARGEYLLINNPDKILEPRGVELLVSAVRADPSIGVLAPKLEYADGVVRPSARSFPAPLDIVAKRTVLGRVFPQRVARYLQLDRVDEQRKVDWVVGGCFLVPHALFRQLGGFDERFFLFFEDTDFCRRCRSRGRHVVYEPAVTARDRKRRLSEGGLFSLLGTRAGRAHMRSAVRYFGKWGMGVRHS